MRIAYIELESHYDCLDAFCRIFSDRRVLVTAFAPESFARFLPEEYGSNITLVFNGHLSRAEFIRQNLDRINAHDLVFIGTISAKTAWLANSDFSPPVVLRVHNVFSTFAPQKNIHIGKSPFLLWKALSYFGREVLLGRYFHQMRRIVRKMDYFTFPDSVMEELALDRGFVTQDRVAPGFPLKSYSPIPESPSRDHETLQITMIGAIDTRRRNYEPVIEAFSMWLPTLSRKVNLTILGNSRLANAAGTVEAFKRLVSPFFTLEIFGEAVPGNVFQQKMKDTDIVLSPIRTVTQVNIFREIYGLSKISGTISDIVSLPRVLLIPGDYRLGKEMASVIDRYGSPDELVSILESYSRNPILIEKRVEEMKTLFARLYGREAILKQITDFMALPPQKNSHLAS